MIPCQSRYEETIRTAQEGFTHEGQLLFGYRLALYWIFLKDRA